jgi:hypothetical protein
MADGLERENIKRLVRRGYNLFLSLAILRLIAEEGRAELYNGAMASFGDGGLVHIDG